MFAFCCGALLGRFHHNQHFCKHVWLEISRTFVDPVDPLLIYWMDNDRRARHITGFTTVLFRCTLCGTPQQEELPGHVHQPKVVPLRKVQ